MRGLANRLLLILLLAAGALSHGEAASLIARVADENGKPVASAVVALTLADSTAPARPDLQHVVIDQNQETFLPYVSILQRGGDVVFQNSDDTRHHVFSFSAIKPFEFVLKPGERSPAVTFDQAGISTIGCNIHDQMITYVFVADTPYVALTGPDGTATLADLPPGRYQARVWHPEQHPGRPVPMQEVTIGDAPATLAFVVAILPDHIHRPATAGDADRRPY